MKEAWLYVYSLTAKFDDVNSTILKKKPDFTSKTNPLMIHVQYILINYTLLLSKCPYEQ